MIFYAGQGQISEIAIASTELVLIASPSTYQVGGWVGDSFRFLRYRASKLVSHYPIDRICITFLSDSAELEVIFTLGAIQATTVFCSQSDSANFPCCDYQK